MFSWWRLGNNLKYRKYSQWKKSPQLHNGQIFSKCWAVSHKAINGMVYYGFWQLFRDLWKCVDTTCPDVCSCLWLDVGVGGNECAVRAAQSCLNNNPSTLHSCNFVFQYLILHGGAYLFLVFFFVASSSSPRRRVSGRKSSGKQWLEFELSTSHTRFEIR